MIMCFFLSLCVCVFSFFQKDLSFADDAFFFFRFVLNMCVEIVAAAAAAIIKEYQQEQRGRKEIGRVEQ